MSSPVLEWRGIVKVFPGAVALAGADCSVARGEVVALLGENGAGKTTLLSVAAGVYRPDAGIVLFDGTPLVMRSPREALERGIGMVYQHFRLVDAFTVVENVVLGSRNCGLLFSPEKHAMAVGRLAREHGLEVDPNARVGTLSVGERQRVEILKMLYRDARVLLLDEPTAVLAPQEVDSLGRSMRRMAAEGRAVVFSTHKLGEAIELADRIVVLRAGRVVATVRPRETTVQALAQMMVGREWEVHGAAGEGEPGTVVLAALNLRTRGDSGLTLQGVTLEVYSGEIVGVAGVAGNGQRELAEVLAGVRVPDAGQIWLDGREVTRLGVRERLLLGLRYIPEDRLGEGLVPCFSVAENVVLRDFHLWPVSSGFRMHWEVARRRAGELVERFQVRARSVDVSVGSLSGGNQQRLLVAREASSGLRVLVACYPTRGLDVNASAEVRRTLAGLRAAGCGILLISESLDELFALSDRILVLHRGRLVGGGPTARLSRKQVGLWMAGAA